MKRSLSRLPVSRARASSTSRVSGSLSSTQLNTPSLSRSKSSLSLRRTPQSVLSSRKGRPKKKEVRPIQDKKWQATSLERTQHYFQQSPEGRQFLNKGISIRPITLKMFVQLTNVVLKNIDSNFDELILSNYTELLPIHLDTLMYPGVVTASTLRTANTMHSWPHILAILSWLVELHELSMMVNVEEAILEIPPNAPFEVQVKKSQTKIIFAFFQQFNKGKETDEKQDELILENMYKKLCNYSEEDYDKFTKILLKLQDEVQNTEKVLNNNAEIVSALENESNTFEAKIKHFYESIDAEIERRKNIIAKNSEFINENMNIGQEIKRTEILIEELKETILNQPMNHVQRTKDQNQIEDLKREIAFIKEKKSHQLNLRDEEDMKLSKIKQKIEQVVHNYNIEIMRPSLQYPELNKIALPQDKLLQPNMIEVIKKNTEMKQKLLNDLESKIHAAENTVASLTLSKENVQQNNKTIERKIQEENNKQEVLTQKYEAIIKTREQAEKEREAEITELKQKLSKIKEDIPNVEYKLEQLKEAKARCEELKSKLYVKSENMEKFFEKIQEEIRTKQIPRYEKIRKTITRKLDNVVELYSSPPSSLNDE